MSPEDDEAELEAEMRAWDRLSDEAWQLVLEWERQGFPDLTPKALQNEAQGREAHPGQDEQQAGEP